MPFFGVAATEQPLAKVMCSRTFSRCLVFNVIESIAPTRDYGAEVFFVLYSKSKNKIDSVVWNSCFQFVESLVIQIEI